MKNINYKNKPLLIITLGPFLLIGMTGCKKLVQIDEPVSSITTKATFSSDVTATSAVVDIYSKLINTMGSAKFGSGGVTIYAGLSADELTKAGISDEPLQFFINNLLPQNLILNGQMWTPAYFTVYQSNSCLEGLQNSDNIHSNLKNQLIGECKFLRGFSYFYLTNFWGAIPMPLTSDWNKTYSPPRTSKSDVYKQILSDLEEASDLLSDDYSFSSGERIRANKASAHALLARVYLYQKDWAKAENFASAVIDNTTYALDSNLNNVFLANSSEAILQFQPDKSAPPFAVSEQYAITQSPAYYLTDTLVNSFELLDKRKIAWMDATLTGGSFLYPYKYKILIGTPDVSPTEYYTVLRLAEQYLIRAEARAQQNKINESQTDLNIIRSRAGLQPTTANDKQSLLLAIEQERKMELFAEWGHRWFDLTRTDRANLVLGPIKGSSWQSTDILYPIPIAEIQNNSNLTQNQGY